MALKGKALAVLLATAVLALLATQSAAARVASEDEMPAPVVGGDAVRAADGELADGRREGGRQLKQLTFTSSFTGPFGGKFTKTFGRGGNDDDKKPPPPKPSAKPPAPKPAAAPKQPTIIININNINGGGGGGGAVGSAPLPTSAGAVANTNTIQG
ncbi:hypothetical protein GPECTOR_19g277 [Gonium pectorale]|uniref:Uncharacterized protein n=1 Tax=Gonium pectorale TaxID=33097 RepID=A0A150GJ60_GONPE|nr:hypothetical protein GPECTOR_19g277 [Gonium pectorale]|eukprot:KXZ49826.1 hypothetical protein GPECTOR_19g277 [Gonium pectorale]